MPDFSSRLKELRISRGLTQQGLATILNVSQNAIYNWENGKRQPDFETLEFIADIFNVDIDFLLGRTNKTTRIINPFSMQNNEYIDDYIHEIGNFLYYNPTHKPLFDASMKVKTEDVELAKQMLNRINGNHQ